MTNSNEKEGTETSRRHCRHRCWRIPFVIAAIILIKSALVMLLWNALIPDLFRGPVLTYLQAVGLTVLVKLLTFGGPGRHFGGRFGGPPPWVRAKWMSLSSEEREKLREDIRKRCGDS